MNGSPTPLLVLDLLGTFAFALNGGLTAVRVARVDIVGVLTLGMITAMGGGIIRDILLGDVPRQHSEIGDTLRWRQAVPSLLLPSPGFSTG